MHWDTVKQDIHSTVGRDGGWWVGEVRAGTTSNMPAHKGLYDTTAEDFSVGGSLGTLFLSHNLSGK